MPARSAWVTSLPGGAALRRQAQITPAMTSLKTAICTDLMSNLAVLMTIGDKWPLVKSSKSTESVPIAWMTVDTLKKGGPAGLRRLRGVVLRSADVLE